MASGTLSPHDGLMSPHLPIPPEDLRPLLLRATRFALSRQRDQLPDVGEAELDELAVQAADDALVSILRQLDDYRGASRFTTWAYKFAVHEAGVTGRRRRDSQDTPVSAPRLSSMQRRSSA
jgi:DNA-directed RNA polymerase specialized sigma24 family protein